MINSKRKSINIHFSNVSSHIGALFYFNTGGAHISLARCGRGWRLTATLGVYTTSLQQSEETTLVVEQFARNIHLVEHVGGS